MLHPVGSLPASVYWRRRAVAIAAALGVLLVVWVALPHGDGGSGSGRQDTAALVGSPSPIGGEPTSLAATPPAGDPGRAGSTGAGGAGPATPTTTGPAAAAAEALHRPCPLAAGGPRAARVPGRRQAGVRPGGAQCLGGLVRPRPRRRLQEVLLYAGARRLWSSNDCYPEGERNVRVLRPAESATFSVEWSGLSSRPSCAGTRARVGTGTYAAVARLGTLVSPRARLDLR